MGGTRQLFAGLRILAAVVWSFLVAAPTETVAGRAEGPPTVQTPAETCGYESSPFLDHPFRVERVEANLGPPGAAGAPLLCLAYFPEGNAYQAILVAVENLAQFRAAKAEAVRRLHSQGFDPCRISTWRVGGVPPLELWQLERADRIDLPGECAPRVEAGDAELLAWVPFVQETLDDIVEQFATTMGWRSSRPLRVILLHDPDAALAAFMRYHDLDQTEAAYMVDSGRSQIAFDRQPYGSVLSFNLTWAEEGVVTADALESYIGATLVHEYTHFAQYAISAAPRIPTWFLEGQGRYLECQLGGREALCRQHLETARAAREAGTAWPLALLARRGDWDLAERQVGDSTVYGYGYAAVQYLVERYGFAATVQLLRDHRQGGEDEFHALLARLTGLDLEAFDAAVGQWLLQSPP
jgi:hypothetical protein